MSFVRSLRWTFAMATSVLFFCLASAAGAQEVPKGEATTEQETAEKEASTSPASARTEFEEEPTFSAVATVEPGAGPGGTTRGGTGSRMEIPIKETPATVNVIEMKTIRERGGADLTDVLFLVPGITPAWEYGGFLQIRSRGFRAIVLNDGRRDDRSVFVNSHPQGGLWDLERIEVLKGPASMLYGHGAVGGVVNLIRRRPSSKEAYELDLALGTPEQWRAHVGATGPITEGLTYRLDLGQTTRRDFRDHRTERTQGTLSLAYAPHRDHAFLLRTAVYQDHYNTDTGIPTIEGDDGRRRLPPNARLRNRYNSPQDGLDYRRIDFELGYEWSISDHLKLRERLAHTRDSYAYFSMEGLEYDASGERPVVHRTFPFYFHHHWYPWMNQVELLADVMTGPIRHRAILGHDWVGMFNAFSDRASNIFDADIPPVDFRHPIDVAPRIPIERDSAFVASMQSHGVFAQDHVSFPYGFHLLLGGRLDFLSFESRRDRFDPVTGNSTQRGVSDERNDVGATYRVGLVHEVVEPWSWYVSYATSFAPNARLGLQPAIVDDEDNFLGYRKIEPERGAQVEVGTRLLIADTLDLHLAGYSIARTNVTIPVGAGRFDTAGEVKSRGLEADLTFRSKHVNVLAGYGFTDAYFVTFTNAEGQDLAGRRPQFVGRHSATLWLTFLPIDQVGISFGGRALGRQFADERNRLAMEPYVLADAAFFYRLERIEFLVTVQNLFQQRRYFVASIENNLTPGPPREALAQVRLKF